MANTKQSQKRARQTQKRQAVNTARVSRIRTFIRKVRDAIATGDAAAATEQLRIAQPEIMRGATKGVLHKRNASRKVSRLAQAVKKLALSKAST
jgi:small subunit ribosomal protein S20